VRLAKSIIFAVFAGCVLVFASPAYSQLTGAGNSGPITGRHGFPSVSDSTTCTGCHKSTPAKFTASASISGPLTVPRNAISDFFTLTGGGGTKRGFNIAIYRVSTGVKQTTAFSDLGDGINDPPASNELQHAVAEERNSWSFKWTAPSTLDTYRVYACVNPVNGDGNDGSDDGNAACTTYSFTVNNTAPVADPESTTVNENGTRLINDSTLLFGDIDASNDSLSVTGFGQPSGLAFVTDNGSSVTYNPNGKYEGLDSSETDTDTFTYTVSDGSLTGTGTVTVTINGANDAPIAVADGSAELGNGYISVDEDGSVSNFDNVLTFGTDDSDVDVETLTASRNAGAGCDVDSPTQSTSFTLNANGSIDYVHNGNEPVQDFFSYCAFDGDAYSAPVRAYIDIAGTNDDPVIKDFAGEDITTDEQTTKIIDGSLTIEDIDSDFINRARITISGNHEGAFDSLACGATFGGISCNYLAPVLTLTQLSGTTRENFASTIAGVTFSSTSDNPLQSKTINLDVRDELLGVSDISQKTITITRTNDPPTLAPIVDQNAFENTAADPYTFTYTAVASDVDVDDDINNGLGSLTYSLSGEPVGMTIDNTAPNHGKISWQPPSTGFPATVYRSITVLITDEETLSPNSVSFNITVSPPDDDGDLIENYNDFCPEAPAVNFDPDNRDNDNDGTAGTDTDPNDSVGGDVCDIDDDNDTIPDAYELANEMDPRNASDALADNDNDGVDNLTEYNDGTNPNFANPFDLPVPDPASVGATAIGVVASDYGPYRPGRHIITWTGQYIVLPMGGAETIEQTLDVIPLVNFSANQLSVEGATATVEVTLNGVAPSFASVPPIPVTVDYSVSGTANNPLDHDAAAGTVTITPPNLVETITIMVANDALTESNETLVLSMDTASNAVIGSSSTHSLTIVEGNVAPNAALEFDQGGALLVSAYSGANGGMININASAFDLNPGETATLNYDWSGSEASLMPPLPGMTAAWTTPALAAGNYLIDVIITDSGAPTMSTRVTRVLNVRAGTVAGLGLDATDTDGDGTDDNVEGDTDADGDGIPNYLDKLEAVSESNYIPDQTVDIDNSFLIVTQPGLSISTGDTAQASGTAGVLLSDTEIENFGSSIGDPPVNADDNYAHFGGIYNFEVSGIIPGASARVVIPLQTSIPRNAIYRKYNPATGWGSFAANGNNRVASALGVPGACPAPGSSEYQAGLHYLDNCIELLISDGGPNDIDNSVNGVIADPGTIGVSLSDPVEPVVEQGGGRLSPLMLILLMLLAGIGAGYRIRGARLN